MDAELARKARFYADGNLDTQDEMRKFLMTALKDPAWRREMADDVGYSMSTVDRWSRGDTAPHECLIHGIGAWVLAKLESAASGA